MSPSTADRARLLAAFEVDNEKMKSILVLCTLAALALTEASVVRAPTARSNLVLGYIQYGDRLLARQYLAKGAIPNGIQYQDLIYRGNATTRISCIQAIEVGYTQWASAWLVSGGIGWNTATIRVQSARGYGYSYQIDIWGR
ncbi:transcription activator MBF2 domain-containing protein [Phthorimaea operculella]|nr:transcription activator MBF2 domain-containing protein [Phthorimaea operculella]